MKIALKIIFLLPMMIFLPIFFSLASISILGMDKPFSETGIRASFQKKALEKKYDLKFTISIFKKFTQSTLLKPTAENTKWFFKLCRRLFPQVNKLIVGSALGDNLAYDYVSNYLHSQKGFSKARELLSLFRANQPHLLHFFLMRPYPRLANATCTHDESELLVESETICTNATYFKLFLDAGLTIDARMGQYLYTPLHKAALKGNIEVAKLLLAAGADSNAITKEDHTPLMLASIMCYKDVPARNYLNIVKLLLNSNALSVTTTRHGDSALDICLRNIWDDSEKKSVHYEIQELLRLHMQKNTPMEITS